MKTKLSALFGALVILISVYSAPAMSFSIGVGVSGGAGHVEVKGKENLQSVQESTATEDAQGGFGSVYVQALIGEEMFGEGNGLVIGYEQVVGEATLNGERTEVSNIISIVGATETGRQYAEAVVDNINTVFVETPALFGLYLRAGWSEMDITTNEELFTGGTYGNTTSDGATYGFGFRSKASRGFQTKVEFNYTDWDKVTLTNTNDSAADTIVTATPEVWSAKIAVGYNY